MMKTKRKAYNNGQSKVTDEQVEYALRRLKEDGAHQQDVCKELKCHVQTLKKAFKAKGITIDPKWKLPDPKLYERAVRLSMNGLSYEQVSVILGLKPFAIHYYCIKNWLGRPPINFKMTEERFKVLKKGLQQGQSKKTIAEKFETIEAFVTLMIVWLGCKDYFKWRTRKSNNGLTEQKVKRYISGKFKGLTTTDLIKELKTTKPTFNKLCADIEAHYMRNINI